MCVRRYARRELIVRRTRARLGRTCESVEMDRNDPFAMHPEVPTFTVTSTTLNEGDTLGLDQMSGIFGVPGGKDRSPQLSWSGAPAETQGYAVTIYDGRAHRIRVLALGRRHP